MANKEENINEKIRENIKKLKKLEESSMPEIIRDFFQKNKLPGNNINVINIVNVNCSKAGKF